MIDWLQLGAAAAPILAAVIVVVGGALAYRRQKSVDRFEELLRKRREVYAGFLTALTRWVGSRDPASHDVYQNARCEIFVYGSDRVVRRVKAFVDLLETQTAGPTDEKRLAYAAMVHAIREDCFEASNLSIDELSRLTIHPGRTVPALQSVDRP